MIRYPSIVLTFAAALTCATAWAQGGDAPASEDMDWLIARHQGEWQLVAKGPRGRVLKEYPNQEVLRLAEGGALVEVVSMPPIRADETTYCSQRARREASDPCSSSFLACRPDPAGVAEVLGWFAVGGSDAAADRRSRLACRVDVDAILRAALNVGMIRYILPVQDPDR